MTSHNIMLTIMDTQKCMHTIMDTEVHTIVDSQK